MENSHPEGSLWKVAQKFLQSGELSLWELGLEERTLGLGVRSYRGLRLPLPTCWRFAQDFPSFSTGNSLPFPQSFPLVCSSPRQTGMIGQQLDAWSWIRYSMSLGFSFLVDKMKRMDSMATDLQWPRNDFLLRYFLSFPILPWVSMSLEDQFLIYLCIYF